MSLSVTGKINTPEEGERDVSDGTGLIVWLPPGAHTPPHRARRAHDTAMGQFGELAVVERGERGRLRSLCGDTRRGLLVVKLLCWGRKGGSTSRYASTEVQGPGPMRRRRRS